MAKNNKTISITGGAGYVGSALVPRLLEQGFHVKVLDLFLYGKNVFGSYNEHPSLTRIVGDIRDGNALKSAFDSSDSVIHLACISNDPSFELNPSLGRSINLDSFSGILKAMEDAKVSRFIYASSSSVYGVRPETDVTEDSPKNPLTDYSRFKLECEDKLQAWTNPHGCIWTIVRPATVCGYAHRLRLDLTVNILTIHAMLNKKIRVFGGEQLRPNIHIQDMVRVYQGLLATDSSLIHEEVFNAGYQNKSVSDIANIVRLTVADDNVELLYESSSDNRSYHVNSEKIFRRLGFRTEFTIEDAVQSLIDAFNDGLIDSGLTNPFYYNIKRMQEIELQ
jgi:nucleoside-diphosphate-sugar epimerase